GGVPERHAGDEALVVLGAEGPQERLVGAVHRDRGGVEPGLEAATGGRLDGGGWLAVLGGGGAGGGAREQQRDGGCGQEASDPHWSLLGRPAPAEVQADPATRRPNRPPASHASGAGGLSPRR